MAFLLADVNAEGQLQAILRVYQGDASREVWDGLEVGVRTFADLNLPRNASTSEGQRAGSSATIRRRSGRVAQVTSKELPPGRSIGHSGSTAKNRSTGWMSRLIRGVL